MNIFLPSNFGNCSFNFLVEYKEITQCDFIEIKNLDFSKLQSFCERGTDVMENHAHKVKLIFLL